MLERGRRRAAEQLGILSRSKIERILDGDVKHAHSDPAGDDGRPFCDTHGLCSRTKSIATWKLGLRGFRVPGRVMLPLRQTRASPIAKRARPPLVNRSYVVRRA